MEQNWVKKFRILNIALVISGALNIGLIAAFAAFSMQDRSSWGFAREAAALPEKKLSNPAQLTAMSKLSFRELVALLTNRELIEEGYSKRDLALSTLVAFHHFNLEKALGSTVLQKREMVVGNEIIALIPGLSDESFEAVIRFAYQEKWPLTAKGLYTLLQRSVDESLEQAFFITPEFYALQVLFQKTEAAQEPSTLLRLVLEGNWDLLDRFAKEQMQLLDLSVEKRRRLLLSYLAHRSPTAAELLLKTDFVFAQKRLDDRGILDLVSLVPESEDKVRFCRALVESPRSDCVRKAAFEKIGDLAVVEEVKPALVPEVIQARYHTVAPGESLWKIAKEHKVKVEEIVLLNGIEQGKIYPGMTLKIPE